MLRPIVRSFGRRSVIHCQCRVTRRRIHVTPIRSNDDSDKVNHPPVLENAEDANSPLKASANKDNETNTEANEDTDTPAQDVQLAPLPDRIREGAIARQQELEDGIENQQNDISFQPTPTLWNVDVPETTSPDHPLQEDEFKARQLQRQARIQMNSKKFNIPVESVEERNRIYRQDFYYKMKQSREEANKRGEEIFAKINAARAERGEPLIGETAREELRREQLESRRSSPQFIRGQDDRGFDRRGSYEPTGRTDDGIDPERPRDVKSEVSERLDRRIERFKERKGLEHQFSPTFDPSTSMYQGNDEVDFELGYDLPDPFNVKDMFSIANRDGTVNEERRTNRDWDELPEDAGSYLDISEFGPVGRTFYAPELPPMPTETEVVDEVARQKFTESEERDVQELMQIKEEIESGLSQDERHDARMDREINKSFGRLNEKYSKGVHHGTWGHIVPLPRAHLPETADLNVYEPPVITHESFKYGIPALPIGSQGRLRAAHSAAFDITDPLHPSLDPEDLNVRASTENAEKVKDPAQLKEKIEELQTRMNKYKPESIPNLPPFKRGMKVPNPPTSSARPAEDGEKPDFQRSVRFDDIYDDNQLAIWREMNADSFAPPGVTFPTYEDEDVDITPHQEIKEAKQRLEAFQVMNQLDAATLKNFRKRDEFEIRDIRRRLGLPIVNDSYAPEAYIGKTSLDAPSIFDPPKPVIEGQLSNVVTEEVAKDPPKTEIEGQDSNMLEGEIADAELAPEIDDSKQRLQFWRDSKTYLASLAARIEQLRNITQSTSDRMRRHGTAELVQARKPEEPATGGEVIDETSDNGIMARLKAQFTNVHKKLQRIEILTTAMRLGPGGPQDPEYSAAWVEANLHAYEKKEFEETAVRMGFAPNSVSMDPQMTEKDKKEWADLTSKWYDYTSRIGVAGQYRDIGSDPGENLPYPMDLAGRYASKSGLNQFQKSQRVWMLGHTFHKMGIEMEDPLLKVKEEGEKDTEKDITTEDELWADLRQESSDEAIENVLAAEEDAREGEENEESMEDEEMLEPSVREPGERMSSNYTKIVNELRKSMREVDRDLASLEDNYDSFLQSQSSQATIPSPKPPQEASI